MISSDYATIKLGPKYVEALSGKTQYCNENSNMIKVRPPKQNDGVDASINLLRSLHNVKREKQGLTGEKNISEVSGMEFWYDKEELQFLYYVPNDEIENDFRRQIDGYFKGSRIESERDRFITVNEGDYISGADVWLSNHYFEPIRNKEGVEEWDDPYQMLFNGIDTRDATRTFIQILFKPAEEEWTRTPFMKVDDYAEDFQAEKTDSSLGGLISTTRDATQQEVDYASKITQQAGRPAFYVNIRFVIVSQNEEETIRQAENVERLFNVGYREVSGQTLEANPAKTEDELSELIRKMAAREATNMQQPSGYLEHWKHANFADHRKRMIMTLTEVAGITHFPTSKEVESNAISWTDTPVEGSLPHNAQRFVRLTREERKAQLNRWKDLKDEIRDDFDITEEDMNLANGRPNLQE